MAKLKDLKVRLEVDNTDMIKKFKQAHRETENFSNTLHDLLSDIKIGIRVVHLKDKKWWQVWK